MSFVEENIVERINNLYHDLDAHNYDKKHEDILVYEKERWNSIFAKYLKGSENKILDYGCGTGFLSSTLLESWSGQLSGLDCFDPSKEMLDFCCKKIGGINYDSGIKVSLLNNINEIENYDIVILNSVLHHLPSIGTFFQQTSRLLKEDGILIIGHEPNKTFFENRFLFLFSKLVTCVKDPKSFLIWLLDILYLKKIIKKIIKFNKNKEDEIVKEINRALISEGLIDKEIGASTIYQYIDFHSPTASGKLDSDRGFDKDVLEKLSSEYFSIVEYNTYDFLNRWPKGFIIKMIDKILSKLFFEKGSKFYVVFRKKASL